jgi:flagellar biosynthetic protein FlhB
LVPSSILDRSGAAAFWLMGPWMVQRVSGIVRRGLVLDHDLATEPTLMLVRLADISLDALLSFAPLFAALIVAALLSPFFLGSWNFSAKALQPDLSRLNLLKGLARVISWNGLVELVKAVVKSSLVGGVAVGSCGTRVAICWRCLRNRSRSALAERGPFAQFQFSGHRFGHALDRCGGRAVSDLAIPRQAQDDACGSQEGRQGTGRQSRSQEPHSSAAARGRPQADDVGGAGGRRDCHQPQSLCGGAGLQGGMGAPKLLAKGMGEVALKIRQIGAENTVPTVEAAPLARALYRHGELDQEIPAALYAAVAEVLAYVYQLSSWRAVGGTYPLPPREIAVPERTRPGGRAWLTPAPSCCRISSPASGSGSSPVRC